MGTKSVFLVVIGWLFLVAVGLFVLTAMTAPQYATDMVAGLVAISSTSFLKWVAAAAGALLIALALMLPFIGRSGAKREKPIEFTSEVGSMIIEASALEDCLRRTALEDEDVTEAQANIRVPEMGQDQPIVCSMKIGIRERPNIPGKGGEIAKKIRDKFLEILPMDTPPIVNLDRIAIQRPKPTVTRTFTGVPGAPTEIPPDDLPEVAQPAGKPAEAPPKPPPAFTGIVQYPIDSDEEKSDVEEEKHR